MIKDNWKTAAVTATSCVIMMVSFWLIQAKDYVTRNEVSDMIQTESPYLVDKQLVSQSRSSFHFTLLSYLTQT